MSTPRVAVIGASARAAAHSLRRAGYRAAAVDRFADADLIDACDGAQFVLRAAGDDPRVAAWLAAAPVDAWLYVGPLENHPGRVEQLAAVKPLWGLAGDALRAIRSPERLAAAVRSVGWQFPDFTRADRNLPRDGSWLRKRERSGGGCGVAPWHGQESPSSGEACLWQRRVAGTPVSALLVGTPAGATLLAITEQLVGQPWLHAGSFHYCGTIVPRAASAARHAAVAALGSALVEEFALRGLFGIDLIAPPDDDAPWSVLEVNPRYTAAVEPFELATGRSAIAMHAAAFDSAPPRAAPADVAASCVGKAVLFAPQPLLIDARLSAAWLARGDWRKPLSGSETRVADIPAADAQIPAGGPICTVLAGGASPAAVRSKLEQTAAAVYNEAARSQPS